MCGISNNSVAALRGVEIGVGFDLSERAGDADVPRFLDDAGDPAR